MLGPGVAIATSALISFVLLRLLGSLLYAGRAGVAGWFGVDLAVVVALPLILLRGKVLDVLSVVVVNTLLALSGAAYYAGRACPLGHRPQWFILPTGVTMMGIVVIYWRYTVDSIPMRVFSTMLFSGAFYTAPTWMLLRHLPADRSTYSYRVTTIIALVFGVCQLIHGVYFLTLHAASNPSMLVTAGSVLLLVVTVAIMPILSMSAMLMVHDVLLADAHDTANRDFLTGALSRQGFETSVRRHVGRVLRHARSLALLIPDLGHFKRINDTLSHAAGDAMLRMFVQMTQTQLRPINALGRIGGEEFALLLPDTDSGNAVYLVNRLRGTITTHAVMVGAQSCHYSLSGGVTVWQPGELLDRLNARVSRALYGAKYQGCDRIRVADVVNVTVVAQRRTQDSDNPRGCCHDAV